MKDYGRGTDFRFLIDSHVIIGFKPDTMDHTIQMAGRSSRTMNVNTATLICDDPMATDTNLADNLLAKDSMQLKDGI